MVERKPCAACHKPFAVTAAGVMRHHTKSTWLGGGNYETTECPGVGKPPLGAQSEEAQKTANVKAGKKRLSPLDAQKKAYEHLGLTWSKQAINASVERHLKGRRKAVLAD